MAESSVCLTTFSSHTFDYHWTIRNIKNFVNSSYDSRYSKYDSDVKARVSSPSFAPGFKDKDEAKVEYKLSFVAWHMKSKFSSHKCPNGADHSSKDKCSCVRIEVSLSTDSSGIYGEGSLSVLLPTKIEETDSFEQFQKSEMHAFNEGKVGWFSPDSDKLVGYISEAELDAGSSKYTYNDSLTVFCKVTVHMVNHKPNHVTDTIPSTSKVNLATFLDNDRNSRGRSFTDATILCGTHKFEVHRVVLAAHSAFFRAKIKRWETEEKTIDMSDLDYFDVWKIVDFMYTGKIDIPERKTSDFLAAADKYQLIDLKELCEKALLKTLTNYNALQLLDLARKYNAYQLKQRVIHFINKSPLREDLIQHALHNRKMDSTASPSNLPSNV